MDPTAQSSPSLVELEYEAAPLRQVALLLLCLKFALLILFFDPYSLHVFSQPKALASQAVDVLMIGAVAGLAFQYRRSVVRWSWLHVCVGIFVGAYVIASVVALDQGVALYGSEDRSLGLAAALSSVLLYLGAVSILRTGGDLRLVGLALAISLCCTLLYELIQWLGLDPVAWARSSRDSLPASLGNRGALAQFVSTAAVAAGAVAVSPVVPDPRLRKIAVVLSLAALVGALLAGARAPLLGLGLGGGMVFIAYVISAPSRRSLAARGGIAALLAAGAIGAASLTPAGQRMVDFLGDPGRAMADSGAGDGSSASRLDHYRVAVETLRGRPLFGVGPDNYVVAYPQFRTPESNRVHDAITAQSSTHSWVFKIATDAGIVGLAAFLAAMTGGVILGLRKRAPTHMFAASVAIASFLGTGIVSVNHIATDWLPWLALGLLAAPVRGGVAAAPPGVPTRRGRTGRSHILDRLPLAARVLLGACLVIALLVIKDPFLAARHARDARQVVMSQRSTEAGIRAAEQAVSLDAGRAEYWNDLGLLQLRAERPSEALRSFSQAARRAPYQFTYSTNLARAQLILGLRGDEEMRAAALETALEAEARHPNVPDVMYMLALTQIAERKYEDAVRTSESWHSFTGATDQVLAEAVAGAYLALERPVDAERWVRMVIPHDAADQPKLRLLLARAFAAQARPIEALAQLAFVLIRDPENETAQRLQSDLVEATR